MEIRSFYCGILDRYVVIRNGEIDDCDRSGVALKLQKELIVKKSETERYRKLAIEAVVLGVAMVDPENAPAQWSNDEALQRFGDMLKRAHFDVQVD